MDNVYKKLSITLNHKKQKKHLAKGAFVGRAGFEPAKM